MRITTRALVAAAIAGSFAVLAAGCGGGGAGSNGGGPIDQVITINWGTEPPSLDPGLATDTTSADVLLNIMDPLVKLGCTDLEAGSEISPRPGTSHRTARPSRSTSATTVSWTNGDPVTAHDFEWSWKRTISPELGGGLRLPVLRDRRRAEAYNGCDPAQGELRRDARQGRRSRR